MKMQWIGEQAFTIRPPAKGCLERIEPLGYHRKDDGTFCLITRYDYDSGLSLYMVSWATTEHTSVKGLQYIAVSLHNEYSLTGCPPINYPFRRWDLVWP